MNRCRLCVVALLFVCSVRALFAQDYSSVEKGLAIETSGAINSFNEDFNEKINVLRDLIAPALDDLMLLNRIRRYKDTPLKKETALDILSMIDSDVFASNRISFDDDGVNELIKSLTPDPVTNRYRFDCDTSAFVYLEILETLGKGLPVVLVMCTEHAILRWKISESEYIDWETTGGIEATDESSRYYSDNCIEVAPGTDDFYSLFYLNRADEKFQLNDYSGSIKEIDRAIELCTKNAYAYYVRGFTKKELGHYQEAVADYDKAIDLNPKYAEVYFRRGIARFLLKDNINALLDFDKVVELEPEHDGVYNYRGTLKALMGDVVEAMADFDKAIKLEPQGSFAYYSRGLIRYEMGDYTAALPDLYRAFELDPNNEDACQYIELVKDKLSLR